MPKSDETKYFGNWITTDGLNNKNIDERENISENYLMNILKRQLKHSTLRHEKILIRMLIKMRRPMD